MNIKIIEYTYPIFVISVIYLICDCRDLRHTNNLQDVALDELTKSLPLSMRTNIDSHHDNKNSNKIETEKEILKSESIHKKDDYLHQDTMKEDLAHHDETKREKLMSMNGSVSRKVSHNNYDKHRNGRDVSMIPTYDYRNSFDAANRIKNNKKKTMKGIWPKQNLFPNNSLKAIENREPISGDSRKMLKQKLKQDFEERKRQQHKNVESRKLVDNMLATTISCTLTRASFPDFGYDFNLADTLQYPHHNNNTSASFNLSVDVMTDDYAYDIAMGWTLFQKESHDLIINSNDEDFTSQFYANTTHVFDYYCVVSYGDGKMNETIDDVVHTCFEFVVHNSQTDEMLSDFGPAINVTMSINNNKKATLIDPGRNTTSVNTSFCFDSSDNVSKHEPFNTVITLDDDYSYDTETEENNVDTSSSDVIPNIENNLYDTSCVLTKAEIIPPPCDDYEYFCSDYAFRCTDTSFSSDYSYYTWQDIMLQYCPKTCDTCPPPVSLLENQIQHEEDENITTTFNVSLNMNTDSYANDTSWILFPKDGENSTIFNSSETNTTSLLEDDEQYVIQYNCIISHTERKDNQFSGDDTKKLICYDFEVHDSIGDGLCCEYGGGSFSMNVTTESAILQISDNFEDGLLIRSSFCINHENAEIEREEKFITTEQPTHYSFKRWQCKNSACVCDSKPSLTTNTHENLAFMFEVSMLSDSDTLRDVESAQYRAACWVLYDDPFEYYDLADEGAHNRRMIQRYILASLYFATSPEKWEEHFDFLSSRSECDWNYYHDYWNIFSGISCDEDDNVISIDLSWNNLDGTIVEELSGFRMLDLLYLGGNSIRGTIPSVLGRLSQLRVLNLGGNNLEGTISPQLYNVTILEAIHLDDNRLEGTISETIGNLKKLSELNLMNNNLSGSIPEAIYTLKNLIHLRLHDNKLSSSISSLMGNLNKLVELSLYNNMLTGQIPSTIGSLSSLKRLYLNDNRLSGSIPSTIENMTSLEWLFLSNNTLSGPIPESLFDVPKLNQLSLQDNSVTGSVPDEICERFDDYDYYGIFIEADCRNDVFDPEVSCSCCTCTNESPIWDGDCADATVKVVIDHGFVHSSWKLEWSLTNGATGKKILNDGPYRYKIGLESYGAPCIAYSDCLSFNQISPPQSNTNYTIYLNNNSIHNGTFLSWYVNDDINKYDPPQTLLSFSYNKENQQMASCGEIEFICGEEEQLLLLEPNTTKRIIYNEAIKLSGRNKIHDTYSPQSRALCWMLSNNHYDNKSSILETDIIQRYVLAILHTMSPDGLFRNHEYPPNTDECNWNGITCKDNDTKNVTGISLSNQIIDGTIIEELGSLKYLEVLDLSQTQLYGSIPQIFANLWSLKELNLSGNEINGTLPTTLFRQLNKLEYVNLTDNYLGGTINEDIGSYSNIRVLSMRNNSLTGPLPLDKFKHRELEHLDIAENELSEIDLSILLEYTKLNFLDISSNFFVGSFLDHTFISLSQLQYLNISQNDISGTIPTTFPDLSNITHFDLHANKFKGTIPLGITTLQSIQHLNLQGNKLTGSLPSELNQLKSLNTLALGHNELKGSIPFDQKNLENINRLHLQNNKLEGEAPQFSNMTYYITDCGFPSDSLDPVSCSSCNTCCNSDGGCQSKSSEELSRIYLTLIFMSAIVGFIIACYALKDRITSNKYLASFFEEKVKNWNALMLISDKSVYHFLLIENKTEWYVAVVCGIFQTATLFLFVHSADMVNDTSDREYFMLCPANSLECEDLNKVSPYGIFIFVLILTIWLLRDIIGSVKLMLVSFEKRNIDFFFTSAVVFSVTMLSLWTSIIYIVAIAGKNTDMIKDAVVLLFVVEIDERIFQLVESVNPDWVHAIDRNMRNSLVYEGKNLIISSWIENYSESFNSLSNMIRRRNNVPPEVNSEDENRVVRRDESNP